MDHSKTDIASHVPFMRAALEEAGRAADSGNTAVAALLRHSETIVACSGSQVETTGNPLDHAEAVVIREVAGRFGRDFLAQCVLYSTMEPCPMCAWAIHLAGIRTIVLGARHVALGRRDLGAFTVESLMQLTGQPLSVISGVLEQECVAFRRAWSQRTHMSGKALLKRRALLQGVVELASGNASTRDLTETPLFEEVERSESAARAPLVEVVRTARRQLLLGIGSRIGSDCIFFVFTFFLLVYLPRLGVPSAVGLEAILAAAIAQIIGIPLSGALSDRIGRRPVLIGGAATTIIWAYVFFMLLHTKVPALIIFASFVGMFFHAGMWGPLGSFLPEMFETRVRCTGASLSFQLAGLLGNALIPIVASQLVIKFDSPWPVAVYLTFWLVVMIACVAAVPETVHADLANIAVRSKGQQRRP